VAFAKGKELPPFKLAFSQSTFSRVQSFLPAFDSAVRLHKNTYSTTVQKNREYPTVFKKAKLYISHFIQVMNMAILRGELQSHVRTFYGITENNGNIPKMHNETDVIKWGEQVIAGETERLRKGMSPIANPTIAVVKVWFEQFMELYRAKEISKKNGVRILNDVSTLRKQADEIILNVWNEVEAHFATLPEQEMRKESMQYGVAYVYRKGEQKPENA
jgi:hypothetical protein